MDKIQTYNQGPQEEVSLKPKPETPQVEYKVPEVKLSENIRKFDRKPRVYTQNPFSYNAVSLKKDTTYTPTAGEMIVNPLYNQTGRVLGIDTIHDWNRYYDKVQKIVEWAKTETGYTETDRLVRWIYDQSQKTDSLGAKRIDDLYIYSKLKTPEKIKPKVIVKKVYIKEKLSTEEMVKRIISGA
jgi:hypothetical protein